MISETNECTDGRTDERMKIEKRGVGRPLLGPANTKKYQNVDNNNQKYPKLHKTSKNTQKVQINCKTIHLKKYISKKFPKFPKVHKITQKYQKVSKNYQKYQKGTKNFLKVSKITQKVSKITRKYPKIPKNAQRYREVPKSTQNL